MDAFLQDLKDRGIEVVVAITDGSMASHSVMKHFYL